MRFILDLAWKNLFRHRRRTMITAAAIAFGIAIFIWMDAFLLGMEKDSERNLVWYETGSAKIMNREYWEKIDNLLIKHVIDDPAGVINRLELENVKHTQRIVFGGELFFGEGSLPAKLIAIDPNTDRQVFRLEESIVEGGRYLAQGRAEILIGQWLAADLGAELGDIVEIRTRTRHGAMQTMELEIVGILNCPNPIINKGTGFLPISVARYDLDMEGAVTEIVLSLPGGARVGEEVSLINETLASSFPELTALTWQELATDFIAMAEMKSKGSGMLIFLILVIAAVGISNTMLIAVYERFREIGMMRALGMKESSIRLAFLLEAGGIGLLGSLVGLILGSLATYWIVNWGIDYGNLLGDMDIGYRIKGVFRGAWHPEAMVSAVFFGTLISMAVALLPASRALKMKISDCLRHE